MGHTLGAQVSFTDKDSVFANLPMNGPHFGGSKWPFDWRQNGAPVCPTEPGDRRKRQPLGAGKHAAELG